MGEAAAWAKVGVAELTCWYWEFFFFGMIWLIGVPRPWLAKAAQSSGPAAWQYSDNLTSNSLLAHAHGTSTPMFLATACQSHTASQSPSSISAHTSSSSSAIRSQLRRPV